MLGLHFPWYLFSITMISWWNLSSCWSPTSIRFGGDKSRGEDVKSASSVTFWCPLTDTLSAHYLQAQHNPRWLPRKLWTSCMNASQAADSVGFCFLLKSTTNTPSLNFGFTLDAEMQLLSVRSIFPSKPLLTHGGQLGLVNQSITGLTQRDCIILIKPMYNQTYNSIIIDFI